MKCLDGISKHLFGMKAQKSVTVKGELLNWIGVTVSGEPFTEISTRVFRPGPKVVKTGDNHRNRYFMISSNLRYHS